MNIVQHAKTRHSTKDFDPERRISPEMFAQVRELLRYAPSSVNSQPWHFVVAASDEAKARIAKATQPGYGYNEAKIRKASHVIVFCSRAEFDDAHLVRVLEQESRDGRFSSPEAKAGQDKARRSYLNMHRFDYKDVPHWMEKQVYLALGSALLGVSALGLDTCPMEGFDSQTLDAELGLREQGLSGIVILALGYRGAGDFNATQPKSRLPEANIFTEL